MEKLLEEKERENEISEAWFGGVFIGQELGPGHTRKMFSSSSNTFHTCAALILSHVVYIYPGEYPQNF